MIILRKLVICAKYGNPIVGDIWHTNQLLIMPVSGSPRAPSHSVSPGLSGLSVELYSRPIYLWQRIKDAQLGWGRRHGGAFRCPFRLPFLEGAQSVLFPQLRKCSSTWWRFCPGKPTRGSAFVVFTGGQCCGHPLPSMCPNSTVPEGKQVFSINHIVCTDSGSGEPLASGREQWEHFTDLASRPFKGQPSAHCYPLLHTIKLGMEV